MKLDALDKRIINYLYHNYREPLTVIAKSCKLSRDQVEYRLGKFKSSGLIKKYITIFDYSLLGFNELGALFVKFDPAVDIKQVIKWLSSHKNVISAGTIIFKYDIFCNLVLEKYTDAEVFLSELKNLFGVQDYEYVSVISSKFFPLKNFVQSKTELTEELYFKSEKQARDISGKDLLIFNYLEKDGRIKLVDLSKKTKISSKLLAYKLKNYYKRGIIPGVRIQFNMSLLGFHFYCIRLELKDLNEKFLRKLDPFCRQNKHINGLTKCFNKYSFIIQLCVKPDQLKSAIASVNNNLSGHIVNSQVLFLDDETTAKTLPF